MSTLPDGYHALAPGKLATLVTYLDMTVPPPPRGHAPAGYALAPVATWDLAAYRRLYIEIGWEWLWSSRLLMSDAELAARLGRPDALFFTPVLDGRAMGVLEIDVSGGDAVEISFFGLVPAAIGGGVGRWMMEEAIRLAFARPQTRRLWLHTCHLDSPQALPFYQRMGFQPYARAVEVFDDPRLLGRLDASAGPHIPLLKAARRPDGV